MLGLRYKSDAPGAILSHDMDACTCKHEDMVADSYRRKYAKQSSENRETLSVRRSDFRGCAIHHASQIHIAPRICLRCQGLYEKPLPERVFAGTTDFTNQIKAEVR